MSNASAQRRKYRRKRSISRTAIRTSQRGENKFTKESHLHLMPGTLEGWHASEAEAQRHTAIRKAVRKHGYATVIRKLTVVGNLNENQSPETTRKVREDVAWTQKNFAPAREYS